MGLTSLRGKKMRLAVLMCVYNGDCPVNFAKAVNSMKSDVHEIRIYLHIDGNISQELEKKISELRIYKTIKSDSNVGLAAGLNKLIATLENERYIFRMDSDDVSKGNRIDEQVCFMESNKGIDVSGGYIEEFIGNESNTIYIRKYPLVNSHIQKIMFTSSPLAHVTACFRGNFFDNFGPYPTDYPLNEDIALWTSSSRKGATFGNIDRVLVKVRMDGAYDRRTTKKAIPEFKVYLKHCISNRKLPIKIFARLAFRFFPVFLTKKIYVSEIRRVLTDE
nr:UDP-Gal:alpha-D-GlcNAc-diphosphoundecaprenol beta-1,3-galactosyltransferase [Vibrio mimicus]